MSQSYSLRFPRRNRAAASNSSGVVGSTGRKAPSMPRPREISPNIVRSIFIDSFADAKIMKFLTDTAVRRTFDLKSAPSDVTFLQNTLKDQQRN